MCVTIKKLANLYIGEVGLTGILTPWLDDMVKLLKIMNTTVKIKSEARKVLILLRMLSLATKPLNFCQREG